MKVAIHQPEYLPHLGLLAKIKAVDLFVLLDDVQFNRASLQHRAKIAGPRGMEWLTIPFRHAHPQTIDAVEIADPTWWWQHRNRIAGIYQAAPGYAAARPYIDRLLAD